MVGEDGGKGKRAINEDVKASTVVTTSATTREATVTSQPNITYHTTDLGGVRYVVKPHSPERR
jgi:hypothetical protein